MHNFKSGDKVYHRSDAAPFEVITVRKTKVKIQGDFSGGIHNVNQNGWVNRTEVVPYDETKMKYYIDGKPYRNGQPIL